MDDCAPACLDDILMYSDMEEEHLEHARWVMQHLLQSALFLNLENCEFHKQTVRYLGLITTTKRISMGEDKVHTVTDLRHERKVKNARSDNGIEGQLFPRFANIIDTPSPSILTDRNHWQEWWRRTNHFNLKHCNSCPSKPWWSLLLQQHFPNISIINGKFSFNGMHLISSLLVYCHTMMRKEYYILPHVFPKSRHQLNAIMICRAKSRYQLLNDLRTASAKCNYVTGSLWECLRVVGPEFQGGQIPELTGPMQWPSGAPGSTSERRRQAWEHLESL